VNSDIHLEAVIERVWKCNWRPTLSKFRDSLGGHGGASFEMHLAAMTERVWRCTWRP
jgi:hypothetical protein